MRRTRLSELRPWAIQWQLIILWCLVEGCLKAVWRELKEAWADRHDIAELRRSLVATAFLKWENDL